MQILGLHSRSAAAGPAFEQDPQVICPLSMGSIASDFTAHFVSQVSSRVYLSLAN